MFVVYGSFFIMVTLFFDKQESLHSSAQSCLCLEDFHNSKLGNSCPVIENKFNDISKIWKD